MSSSPPSPLLHCHRRLEISPARRATPSLATTPSPPSCSSGSPVLPLFPIDICEPYPCRCIPHAVKIEYWGIWGSAATKRVRRTRPVRKLEVAEPYPTSTSSRGRWGLVYGGGSVPNLLPVLAGPTCRCRPRPATTPICFCSCRPPQPAVAAGSRIAFIGDGPFRCSYVFKHLCFISLISMSMEVRWDFLDVVESQHTC